MPGNREQGAVSATAIATTHRFGDAFSRHDVDGVMAAMTEDCVFENTFPPPEGTRYEGQEAVRAARAEFSGFSPSAVFETEEMFACGEHSVVRWLHR